MLRLREAVQGDIPEILALIRDLALFERAPDSVTATEDDIRRHAFGGTPLVHVVMAEWDGEVAGFALWFYSFSTWQGRPGLYLEDLFVRPAFRKRGIGRALLVHLAQIAVREGCGRYQWQVLDWNENAIRLYEAMGAQGLREWMTMRVEGEALERLAGTSIA